MCLLIVFLVAYRVVSVVAANYTLEILVEGYQNPTSQAISYLTFRKGCCERDTTLPCLPCDNAFRFCIRSGRTGMVEGACDIAEIETMKIEEDNDDLMFSVGDEIGGLSNPLTISGDVWPEEVEIVFTVYDLDGTVTIGSSSDFVDNIIISPDISSSPTFSDTMTYSGNLSHLQLAFRLTCGPDHYIYGPHCTYCVDTNDTTGHFYCDPVSGKVCLEGYQNPLSNCTECIPGQNCNHVGGYCRQPGQCLCREGYSGENCNEGLHTLSEASTISRPLYTSTIPRPLYTSNIPGVRYSSTVSVAVTYATPTPPLIVTENNVLPPYLIVAVVLMIASLFTLVTTIIVLMSVCGRRKLMKKHRNHNVNTADNVAYQSRVGQVITSNTDEDLYDTIDDTIADGLYSYATLPTTVNMDSNKAYNHLSEVLCDEMKLESNAAYDSVNATDNRDNITNNTETETETITNAAYDSTQGNTFQ